MKITTVFATTAARSKLSERICSANQPRHRSRGGTPIKTLKISQYLSKIPTSAANSTPACRRGYHIPQTTGWSNQMRDFGKFWEVLGRGSWKSMQTTHKVCNHGGTPIKILKISQDLSKIPISAANSTPACHCGYHIPQTIGWSDQLGILGMLGILSWSWVSMQTTHG